MMINCVISVECLWGRKNKNQHAALEFENISKLEKFSGIKTLSYKLKNEETLISSSLVLS